MAKEKRPLKSTTRTFDTTKGNLTYAEYDNGRIAALIDFWQDRFSDTFFT